MKLSRIELFEAQIALLFAIALQIVVWRVNHGVFSEAQYVIIAIEVALAVVIGLTSTTRHTHVRSLQHGAATILIGLITLANFTSLGVVIYALLSGDVREGGALLGSALAIFFTNVIVYALWYWEIDSPGLTNRRWTRSDKDFHFVQQERPSEFSGWRPQFLDYLYISVINSLNGATTSAHPLTRQAKMLMATQAALSIFTLALVVARSVSILG